MSITAFAEVQTRKKRRKKVVTSKWPIKNSRVDFSSYSKLLSRMKIPLLVFSTLSKYIFIYKYIFEFSIYMNNEFSELSAIVLSL